MFRRKTGEMEVVPEVRGARAHRMTNAGRASFANKIPAFKTRVFASLGKITARTVFFMSAARACGLKFIARPVGAPMRHRAKQLNVLPMILLPATPAMSTGSTAADPVRR